MAGLGIYHFNARFYSPKLGRFLSADTIVPNPINPQDLNRYGYVRNNPLRYTDPIGNRPCGDGEKYDCDGRLNPITPSKPPVVIVLNPKPKKDKDPDQNPSDAPGGVVIPPAAPPLLPTPPVTTTESENCPKCILTGGAILVAVGLIELPLLAAAVLAVSLSGPAAVAPIAVVFLPIEIALANTVLIGIEYIAQGTNRPPQDIDIDYLPLLHLSTNPDEGQYFK